MTNTDIVYRYLPERGPRAPYVVGVPARDIAEWELMADPDMEAIILANMQTPGAIYAKNEPVKTAAKTTNKVVDVKVEEEPEEGE